MSDLTEREHNSLGILYGPDVHEDKELYDEVHTEHVNTMATYGAGEKKQLSFHRSVLMLNVAISSVESFCQSNLGYTDP